MTGLVIFKFLKGFSISHLTFIASLVFLRGPCFLAKLASLPYDAGGQGCKMAMNQAV